MSGAPQLVPPWRRQPVASVSADDYADVPLKMREAKRWLLHRDKVPHYVDGALRSKTDTPEDAARLATFEDAVAKLAGGNWTGLGFALGPDGTGNHWQGIDLDKVAENNLGDLADDLPGYVEASPSGKGVHAIGYGRSFPALGANGCGIEAYSDRRFFTVTGRSRSMGEPVCLASFIEATLAPRARSAKPRPEAQIDLAAETATPAQVNHLRSALDHLRADEYEQWVGVGHALKGLGDVGRGLWIQWSRSSDKFDPLDAARKWETFKPERTGFASVFARAQAKGWVNPASAVGRAPGEVVGFPEGPGAGVPPQLPFLDLESLAGRSAPLRKWAWRHMMPAGQATFITGPGSVGKSLLAQQLATHVAAGEPFLGLDVAQCRTLYLTCEDDEEELWRRQEAICERLNLSIEDLAGDLHLASLHGQIGNELVHFDQLGAMRTTQAWDRLTSAVRNLGVRFVVLDNVAHLFSGNENIRAQVTAFCQLMNKLAADTGAAVLFLGHPNKGGADFSGSTAWENAVRSRLYMGFVEDDEGRQTDPDLRFIRRGKANYASRGGDIVFRWNRMSFVRHEDLGSEEGATLAAQVLANKHDQVFLDCLAKATQEGRAASTSRSAGNFAPKLFAGMKTANSVRQKDLADAMERLLDRGVIVDKAVVGRYPNRAPMIGIALTATLDDDFPRAPDGHDGRELVAHKGEEYPAQGLHKGAQRFADGDAGSGEEIPYKPTTCDDSGAAQSLAQRLAQRCTKPREKPL